MSTLPPCFNKTLDVFTQFPMYPSGVGSRLVVVTVLRTLHSRVIDTET